MQFDVRLVIFFGNILYNHVADALTKYACVSFSGFGGKLGGYGGVVGGGWDFDDFNSNSASASSEEFGMRFAPYAGYGTLQHGIAPGVGTPAQVGASAPGMSPGTSPLAAGGLSPKNTAGMSFGLPNSAASLGGASHITGQGSGAAGAPAGQMPFQPVPPGNPGVVLSGSLSCADRPQTTILITKLVYGNGGIYTCSAPDEECDVVDYQDPEITPFCDGQVRCLIRTTGKKLIPCQTTSNFVHVEYECIYPWSSFNICKDIKTVVREPEVYVMSPSFFRAESPPSKVCECILKGRYDNRIMAQYVHTDIEEMANHSCPESFVLFESKLSPNQTELEKKTEVCGRRSLNNYLYKGDLRITFKDSDSGKKSGFVSKLLVPPVGMGVQVEIALECGPVRMEGEPTPDPNSINRNNFGPMPFPGPFGPYSPLGTLNSQFQQSPRIPAPPVFEGVQTMQTSGWRAPFPVINTGPMNWGRPTTNWGSPQFQFPKFSAGPQNTQSASTTSSPPAAWSRNEKPPIPSNNRPALMTATRKQQPQPRRNQGQANRRPVPPKRAQSQPNRGRMVGYVIGGVGAAMTAFCALFISLYCTRRRKREIERKASQRSEVDLADSSSSIEDTPVYRVPSAEDHVHPSARANTGHVNQAYDGNDASCDKLSVRSGSFENIHLQDDDNYLSLDEIEEARKRERGDDASPSLELRIDSKYCQSREVVRRSHYIEGSVYDNNI
ncbi:uncharacterized protein LOC133185243 isoform X2 [Saccostrea echinata]|uniref:uncharacterized protein LOC133185243 isoform X2 n=1 Tax=Saccostrea echinata TaxID=191078 RepID=UPI002A809654|nr:uncharacterized protein LOC133185243 isoform X2 [Saccostrea echinata]